MSFPWRLTALLLALSCAHAKAPDRPATSPEFSRFVDDYFASRFAYAPTRATRVGFHEYDDKLEDLSRDRIESQVADLKTFQARLSAIDRARLSFDDEIDAQLIDNGIRAALLELIVVRGWERNPMQYAGLPGNSVDSLMKRNFAPGPERLRSVIARLSQVPRVYAAARQNLINPPKELTAVAVRMARGSVGFLEGGVVQWAKTAAGGDAALLERFEQAQRPAAAAAREFLEWLEKDLSQRSGGNYAIGA